MQEDCCCLQREAKAIAAALPDASADGFGESGPELLRADVYPRIESGNAAKAKPPRLLNVLSGKILEVWGHFSQSKTLRQSRLSATCRWCDSRRLTARLTVME